MLTGCKQVTYRFHDFEPAIMGSEDLSVAVVLNGTPRLVDSAGHHVDQRASPYRLGIYVASPLAMNVEIVEVRLRGISSGVVITPQVSAVRPMEGDSLGRWYADAQGLEVPHEDLEVEVKLLDRIPEEAVVVRTYRGVLQKKLETRTANSLWERVMGV